MRIEKITKSPNSLFSKGHIHFEFVDVTASVEDLEYLHFLLGMMRTPLDGYIINGNKECKGIWCEREKDLEQVRQGIAIVLGLHGVYISPNGFGEHDEDFQNRFRRWHEEQGIHFWHAFRDGKK